MATRDRRRIQKALKKKGFVKHEGSGHEVYTLEVDGLTQSVATIISRGSSYKEYGSALLGDMSNQLFLSTPQLLRFIDCPMDKNKYLEVLRSKRIIA